MQRTTAALQLSQPAQTLPLRLTENACRRCRRHRRRHRHRHSVEYVPISDSGRPLSATKPSRSVSATGGAGEASGAGTSAISGATERLRTRSASAATPRSRAKQRRDTDIEAELHISKLERKLRLAQSELDKARSELVRERNGKKRLQQARRDAEGEREQIAAAYTLSQKKLEHLQTVLADLEGKGAGAGIGT